MRVDQLATVHENEVLHTKSREVRFREIEYIHEVPSEKKQKIHENLIVLVKFFALTKHACQHSI